MEEEERSEPQEPATSEGEPEGGGQPPPGGQAPGPEGVDQEELRRQIEDQLRRVRVQDLLLESVVSIANLTARRIAKEDERDLEQARLGIEAMRAVVGLLEAEPAGQVRNAISELQVLFAKHAQGGEGAGAEAGAQQAGGESGEAAAEPQAPRRRRDSGLWTPPGT